MIEDHRRATWLDMCQEIKVQTENKLYSVCDCVTVNAAIVFFQLFWSLCPWIQKPLSREHQA